MKRIEEIGVFDVWMPIAIKSKDCDIPKCIGIAKLINKDGSIIHHHYKDNLVQDRDTFVATPNWWPKPWLPEKVRNMLDSDRTCGKSYMPWYGSGYDCSAVDYNDPRITTPTPWGGPAWCMVWNFGQRKAHSWEVELVIGKTIYDGRDVFVVQQGGENQF